MMVSERIRKLARLTPIHEDKLDEIMGEVIVDEDQVKHEGFEYFWRPRHTEVQESHSHHLRGKAHLYEEDHIRSLETIKQYKELGPLAQDVVEEIGLSPTDQTVPDLE